jgi:cell division protein FtsB
MRYVTTLASLRHDIDAYKSAVQSAEISELQKECVELAEKLKALSDAEKINQQNREFLHRWFD